MFTTQHYVSMARVIREHRTGKTQLGNGPLASAYWQDRRDIAHGLADMLADDNPRFNRATLLQACGIPELDALELKRAHAQASESSQNA